jgi:chorismate lyase / 3-hydroxybenzoate synthase
VSAVLHAARPTPALHAVRREAGSPAWLGALDYAALGLPHLAGPALDAWDAGTATLAPGRLRLAQAGGWAFGAIDVDDDGRGLTALGRQAYGEVFAALQALGRPPLLRLWNYLPRINDESSGLERYRQFNIGRQEAFVAAGEDAFAGSPAACALGKAEGSLSIRFLAGRTRVLPLENPRQVPAWRYSKRFGPKAPTFSRAVLADAGDGRVALLVSGTASIVGEDSQHPGDVGAQTDETLVNLRALLDTAHARTDARFALDGLALTVYLRHPGDRAAVHERLALAAPHASANAIWLQADICRSELLVEIEAHAIVPGKLTS